MLAMVIISIVFVLPSSTLRHSEVLSARLRFPVNSSAEVDHFRLQRLEGAKKGFCIKPVNSFPSFTFEIGMVPVHLILGRLFLLHFGFLCRCESEVFKSEWQIEMQVLVWIQLIIPSIQFFQDVAPALFLAGCPEDGPFEEEFSCMIGHGEDDAAVAEARKERTVDHGPRGDNTNVQVCNGKVMKQVWIVEFFDLP